MTPEDLLAGSLATFDITIPYAVLRPGRNGSGHEVSEDETGEDALVSLRPITIGAFQLILKGAKDEPEMIPLLMIKESLIEPALSFDQVKQLHLGVVNFLTTEIRHISGLTQKKRA